jgi:hypothetical protein
MAMDSNRVSNTEKSDAGGFSVVPLTTLAPKDRGQTGRRSCQRHTCTALRSVQCRCGVRAVYRRLMSSKQPPPKGVLRERRLDAASVCETARHAGDDAGGGEVVSEEQPRNNHPYMRMPAEPGRSTPSTTLTTSAAPLPTYISGIFNF